MNIETWVRTTVEVKIRKWEERRNGFCIKGSLYLC